MRDQPHSDLAAHRPASTWPDSVPYVVTLAAFAALCFRSGGYILTSATPVVIAWLVAAAAGVWFVRTRRPPSRIYRSALVALGAYTLWAGISVLWSFGPDLSWVALNSAAFYLAAAAVLGSTPTGPVQVRIVCFGYLAATVAVSLYAFAGKALPDQVTHAHTYARLDEPIGYWNVLALLAVMAFPVAAALAARASLTPVVRALVAAASVPVALTFVFTFSRGGIVALLVVLVVYFVLADRRLSSFVAMAAIVVPVAVVLWEVRELDTLFAATADEALRVAQGHTLLRWTALATGATFVVQLVVAVLERAVRWPRALRVAAGWLVLAGVAAGVVGGAVTYVERQGGTAWIHDRYEAFLEDSETRSTANTAGRLLSVTTGRPTLWRRALEQYDAGPKLGTGAGTYRFTYYRFRQGGGITKHAHSQWINALSELGLPGLVTIAAAMALFVAAALRGLLRGRRDPERALLAALQAGLVAFVVHMTWDWDWDMAAAGLAAMLFAATTAAYVRARQVPQDTGVATERDPTPPPGDEARVGVAAADAAPADAAPASRGPAQGLVVPGTARRVLVSGLLLLLAASWVPPYVAERAQDRAVEEAARGDVVAAEASAQRARTWNPLAVEPLITLALVEQQLGRNGEALETLRGAVALQPQNHRAHYHLGLLLERGFGQHRRAAVAFRRALELNPLDDDAAFELEALGGGS